MSAQETPGEGQGRGIATGQRRAALKGQCAPDCRMACHPPRLCTTTCFHAEAPVPAGGVLDMLLRQHAAGVGPPAATPPAEGVGQQPSAAAPRPYLPPMAAASAHPGSDLEPRRPPDQRAHGAAQMGSQQYLQYRGSAGTSQPGSYAQQQGGSSRHTGGYAQGGQYGGPAGGSSSWGGGHQPRPPQRPYNNATPGGSSSWGGARGPSGRPPAGPCWVRQGRCLVPKAGSFKAAAYRLKRQQLGLGRLQHADQAQSGESI